MNEMPLSECQKTLAAPVSIEGKGVHSGKTCRLAVLPAETGHGVRFFRVDLAGSPEIPASLDVLATEPVYRQTKLCSPGNPEAHVETVEHVLAVLYGCGIDNARIEMTGPEPPIVDGSAAKLAEAVSAVGSRHLPDSSTRCLTIDRPVSFQPPGATNVEYSAWPSESLTITYFLDYGAHPFIGTQAASFRIEPEAFVSRIAPARTFILYEEVEHLLAAGLIQGGDIDSAIVVGRDKVMNTELHWPNELARHKILDLIGDLALLGRRIRGHIVSLRGGHNSNHHFTQYLRKEFLSHV